MTIKQARELYFDSARFWLHRVRQVDPQTINDVLAILDYPEYRKDIAWSKHFGRGQVFTSAVMSAGVVLVDLESKRMGVKPYK